jgi:hypothetical protein
MQGTIYITGIHKEKLDDMVRSYIAEYCLTKNAYIKHVQQERINQIVDRAGHTNTVQAYRVDFVDIVEELAKV